MTGVAHQWDAADYAQHSTVQQKWALELISKLALRGDERVLDIGCGDGKVTAQIAANVPAGSVVGVDMSAEMVQFAANKFPSHDHANLSFAQADASALSFDGEFDVVFSNACLHWVVDHRPVLGGIARALRPGGRFLLQMGGKGNASGILAVLDRMCAESQWRDLFDGFVFPYGFHDPQSYRQWMHDAGLCPSRADLIPKDMIHHGADGLAGWVRTTWLPYVHHVPQPRREAFIEQFVRDYLMQHPLDIRGDAHVAMVRLETAGERL